jgi:hypothetical protein
MEFGEGKYVEGRIERDDGRWTVLYACGTERDYVTFRFL